MIYVLDASKEDHVDIAGNLFEHAINCRKTDGVPLLIFCNKSGAQNASEIDCSSRLRYVLPERLFIYSFRSSFLSGRVPRAHF